MKPAILFPLLGLLFSLSARSANAASPGNPPAASAAFTADDFDWREMVPYLSEAAALPAEQGIARVLENCKVLRAYIASQVHAECQPGDSRCDSSREGFTLDSEVSRRIDGIVKEGIVHRHNNALLDYSLDSRTFPFMQISAFRSEKQHDAYLVLQFADGTYTAAQVQAKYGDPYDTNIVKWHSVYIYRLVNEHYTSKAVFEINPVDGAVIKVAISLKAKKSH